MADVLWPTPLVASARTFFDTLADIGSGGIVYHPFVPPVAQIINPFNAPDEDGKLHRVRANAGSIEYHGSDFPRPPYARHSFVGGGSLANPQTEPRIIPTTRGANIITFQQGANVMETLSWDDGATWSTPQVSFSNAKHPTVQIGAMGEIVRAAYSGGNIVANIQYPGQLGAGPNFFFVDPSGARLSVADDTFQISGGNDGPRSWVLHVRVLGETTTADFLNFDECKTWKRVLP